jgi:hypothetical protein
MPTNNDTFTETEPSTHTYLTDESFLEGPLKFKGIDIPPLSYGRRACILSVVDLVNPQFFDIAGFLYGCVCPEMEIISAKRDVAKWDKAVYRWINKVKFEIEDSQDALVVVTALLNLSEKNKVVPAPKPADLETQLEGEFESDPNE